MSIPLTYVLIGITGLVSYQAFNNSRMFNRLLHHPYTEKREKAYYRWITSGFIHGDMTHLLINLFVFFSFGPLVESRFEAAFGPILGKVNFLVLYFGSMVAADLVTYFKHQNNSSFRSVGASGAIAGIVFSFVLFEPMSQLLLMFVIPMPAILFAVLYVAYSFYASKKGIHQLFDHDAHLWGSIAGLIITIILIPSSANTFWLKLSTSLGI